MFAKDKHFSLLRRLDNSLDNIGTWGHCYKTFFFATDAFAY
jgi:hypothetical protein